MTRRAFLERAAAGTLAAPLAAVGQAADAAPKQLILINVVPGQRSELFDRIRRDLHAPPRAAISVGVGAIFSYLNQPRDTLVQDLRAFLGRSEETSTPVVVQLDGEQWWGNRPDLWNWWDPGRPGYDPANRVNVEWTGWGPEHAVKIAWRNWGRQLRVLPPPNLMSPRWRDACRQELGVLVPAVLEWWQRLPESKRHLLVGIKAGWESSIGVNAWYYPGGNDLLDRPPSEDPQHGLNHNELPGRGVVPIGHAAASAAGIRQSGELTEVDLAEVARRHLADLCREHARLGVPRDRLFTHVAGWKDRERLYQAGINSDSCPGWSFYKYAADPARDVGVQDALARSDAPYWAAVEWLLPGVKTRERWCAALENTLADARCRYVCIYNWSSIRESDGVLQAIGEVVAASARGRPVGGTDRWAP